MILYPAELGFSSFSSSIKHIPKNWMNEYLHGILSAKESQTFDLSSRQVSIMWTWYSSFAFRNLRLHHIQNNKKMSKKKKGKKKRKYPRIISGESYVRNSLLGGDAKIMSRSFIAFSTLGGWRYKIGALKGDTNLLLLVVTLLVSWNVTTNSHPNSAGGRYSSGMSIFFFGYRLLQVCTGVESQIVSFDMSPYKKRRKKKTSSKHSPMCEKK